MDLGTAHPQLFQFNSWVEDTFIVLGGEVKNGGRFQNILVGCDKKLRGAGRVLWMVG